MTTIILRLPSVLHRKGTGRSTTYNEIDNGLFPKPIQLGARAVGWPESEVDAIIAARIAGKNDDEIRALVCDLEAARSHFGAG